MISFVFMADVNGDGIEDLGVGSLHSKQYVFCSFDLKN